MCKDCHCSIFKTWAYLKVIAFVVALIAVAVLAIGGYFYFKDFSEDVPELDNFKEEFRVKMKKV
jgi:Tfp pilus assembly protein PilO